MQGIKRLFCFTLLFVFIGMSFMFSAERYALVIGNGNYRDQNVSALVNPINDAIDVAQALQSLGFNVSLMLDVELMNMINAVRVFSEELGQNPDNEGFFWFAGHGLSVRGVHYLLPVDVNTVDESIIARGSFSVDELMEEIGNAGNVTNLIVIDACRNNLLPTGRRVGNRGLAVLAADDYRVNINKIVYSTMAGRVASDGIPGSRNSPFAEAFISKMDSPETFDNAFIDIRNETLRLTNGDQQPYSMGSFAVKDYSLNPSGIKIAPSTASLVPIPLPGSIGVNPNAPTQQAPTPFTLDGKNGYALGAEPLLTVLSPINVSGRLSITFYERYRKNGEYFILPNSLFVSASLPCRLNTVPVADTAKLDVSSTIFSLGALYKIRFGKEQRFILSFGPTVDLFWSDITVLQSGIKISDTKIAVGPGLYGGLAFRFTPLISLDLGSSLKVVDTLLDAPYDPLHPYYPNYDPGNTGGFAFFAAVSLGVRFWFIK